MFQKVTRSLVLTAIAVLFSITTAVLGAAPLFILRNSEGRRSFIFGTGIAVIALALAKAYAAAVVFGIIALLVLAFYEAASAGAGLLKAGVVATALGTGVSLIAIGVWAKVSGVIVSEYFRKMILDKLSQVPQLYSALAPEIDNILAQAPSALIVMMAATLWLGTLLGLRFINPKEDTMFSKLKLRDFDIPDVFVWIFIAALPGAFLAEDYELWHTLSLNIFNLMVFMYFLKGLAAIGHLFFAYKVGPLWQMLLYVFMITQLFVVIAALGLADVWFNIKAKLIKKTAEPIER